MAIIRVEKHMTAEELAREYPYMWVTMYNPKYDKFFRMVEADIFEVGDYGDDLTYDALGELMKYHPDAELMKFHTQPELTRSWGSWSDTNFIVKEDGTFESYHISDRIPNAKKVG